MKNDSKKRGGGKRDKKFGNKDKKWGRNDRPDMHKATCGKCRASCEVPFKPTGSKVVLCSDCFEQDKKHASPGAFGRTSDRRPSYNKQESFRAPQTDNKEVVTQLKALNEKMDILLDALLADDEDFDEDVYEDVYEDEVETEKEEIETQAENETKTKKPKKSAATKKSKTEKIDLNEDEPSN